MAAVMRGVSTTLAIQRARPGRCAEAVNSVTVRWQPVRG